jgi:predicted transglutaminase-like cysteine proteinase
MRIIILATLALTGCATAPAHLVDAKRSVDNRKEYVYYTGWVKPAGLKPNQGNCAAFSIAYMFELREMGYHVEQSSLTTCRVPDGTGHAVLDVDGWRLDNRFSYVMKINQSDCK